MSKLIEKGYSIHAVLRCPADSAFAGQKWESLIFFGEGTRGYNMGAGTTCMIRNANGLR